MLDPIGTKRAIDTEDPIDDKRQRSQDEQAAALGQLPGGTTLTFAPLAPLEQQLAATQSLLLLPEQPQEAQQLAATQSLLLLPEQPQEAQQPQAQLQHPTLAEPGEKKICFPFLNRGMCQFSSQCKFRHLVPEHPDAIADRVRTGHTHRLAGFTGDAAAQVQAQVASSGGVPTVGGVMGLPPMAPPAAEARVCFSFLNHGTCERGEVCRFRHLTADHPDAVADRMRTGQYDKIPQHVNPMVEQNLNCPPGERRICYNFLNRSVCDKPECGFRHLLPGHPDAIADKMKSRAPMNLLPNALAMGMGQQMAGSRMPGYSWNGAQWQPSAAAMWPPAGGMPGGMYGGGMGGMGMGMGMDMGMQGGMQGGMQRMPAQHVADPSEVRICFTFLNRGQCNREGSCRFRHLAPDHPDAIADRVRTGRLPGASAGAPTQLDMLAVGTMPWGGAPMMPPGF